jgi:hypothetical protein
MQRPRAEGSVKSITLVANDLARIRKVSAMWKLVRANNFGLIALQAFLRNRIGHK